MLDLSITNLSFANVTGDNVTFLTGAVPTTNDYGLINGVCPIFTCDAGEEYPAQCVYQNVSCESPTAYAVPLYGYLMPVLLAVTVVFNTLIVVVLSKRHMRTPTNVVLLSMALCDMFTLLVPAPWLIYMYTLGNHYKPLWPVSVCYAWDIMHDAIPNMFHTASIWLTLALAAQRYIYVCHAPLARKFCTLPNVHKCLIYVLLAAALQQSTKLFDRDYTQVEILWRNNETVSVCNSMLARWVHEYVTEDVYYTTYFLFRIVFVHLVPCVALVVLNLLLFRALKQAQKRRDALLNKNNLKQTAGKKSSECRKLRDSNCTTLMLIVVVTVFLIVETPVAVVTVLHVLSSLYFPDVLDYYFANVLILFTNFFIMLSYPINFAIYCGMSRQFRETFKELFMARGGGGGGSSGGGGGGATSTTHRNGAGGSSKYSLVNGPRTCTNETVL